jgi:hypothetical protein
MRKICREEKCNNYVWGSGYCVCHQPKKEFPRIGRNKLIKATKEFKESGDEPNKMHEFFLSIWKEREHRSQLSGEWLGNEALSLFFHHLLPWRKYPQIKYEKEWIILLTPDEHRNVEDNKTRYELINKRVEELKQKFNIL